MERLDAALCDRPPVLDIAALNGNTMGDPDLQRELFDLYFAHAPTHLAALAVALADGDRATWNASAHGLKGTARTLGLMALADATRRGEHGAPTPELLAEIRDASAAARAEAYAYLASRAAAE